MIFTIGLFLLGLSSLAVVSDADKETSSLRRKSFVPQHSLKGSEWFVSPFGNDNNDGKSRDSPFLTLSKAVEEAKANGANSVGGSITLMKGRHSWTEDEGLVKGLIGPSSGAPFLIIADDTLTDNEEVWIDGSDTLPPFSDWVDDGDGIFCTDVDFHPEKLVQELWFTGIKSLTGGDNVWGIKAQHPNVLGGNRDSLEAWPIPDDPSKRDFPLPGSIWDKSARLDNTDGGTLGLIDCKATVLSPPPKCFVPEGFDLPGDRCTPGCQQITGDNVEAASSRCPLGLPDCPERYHEAFVPHPDPKNADVSMNNCPSAFPSCDRDDQEKNWPGCLDMHNIGYVLDPDSEIEYSSSGSEIWVTACVDKKLLGPFPIVGHDTTAGKIYFDYTNLSVNEDKPGKQTSLWEGMTSCWKTDADKIEEITGGAIKTDYFRMEQDPKYKVVSRNAFDNTLEWWHDGPGEKLCVKIDQTDSTSRRVRVKQRGSMLRLLGSENVNVSGLKFFATEFHAESQDGIGFGITFDKLLVEYPDSILLSPASVTNSIFHYGKAIIRSNGPVANSDSKPTRCVFTNNLIEYSEMGVEFNECAGADIIHNTIHHIYNGDALEIYKHGCECENCEWESDECRFEVAYNRIHEIGFNGHCDCSGIQTKFGAVKEMQIHHNWIYSLPYHKGIRLDTGENGARIYKNVIWNASKGATIKGGVIEGNEIIQNTAFGSKDNDFSVLEYELGTGSTTPWKPYNTKSIVYNNAVDDWRDSGKRKCTEPACVASPGYALKAPKMSKPWVKRWEKCDRSGSIPCNDNWKDLSYWLEEFNLKNEIWKPTGVEIDDPGCQSGPVGKHNSLNYGTCTEGKSDWSVSGSWPKVNTMLRDVGNYDFRPKETSPLVGKGKVEFSDDIGAYEAYEASYNIPGRRDASASSPVPPNGSFNVNQDADLMFLGGNSGVSFRVFFGTSFCSVAKGDVVYTELSSPNNIFTPDETLAMATQYFWRVDTVLPDNSVEEGQVWCFNSTDSSSPANLPTGWNHRTEKSTCTRMNVDHDCESCQDDDLFTFNDEPEKSCQWAKKRPSKRCEMVDSQGRLVKNYCVSSCDNCNDSLSSEPTKEPSPSPSVNPTGTSMDSLSPSPFCADDESFTFDGDVEKTCDWVKAKKTEKRCKLLDSYGAAVSESCRRTCRQCELSTDAPSNVSTNSPTNRPTNEPTSRICQDDDAYAWKNKPERTCAWVARDVEGRCMKEDASGFAFEFCVESCNQCSCLDLPGYLFNGEEGKDCVWVSRKLGKNCSRQDDKLGGLVSEYCSATCGAC